MNTITIVSEKQVYQGQLFSVDQVTLLLPDGKTTIHEIVRRKPTVSVFPITDTHDLYLVSQYRYMLGKTTLEAMAGFIEDGEEIITAGKRELQEETGIKATIWKSLSIAKVAGSVLDADNHLLIAQDLTFGQPNFQDEEDITLIKMPLKNAVEKVLSGEIDHGASMIGILLLHIMVQKGEL